MIDSALPFLATCWFHLQKQITRSSRRSGRRSAEGVSQCLVMNPRCEFLCDIRRTIVTDVWLCLQPTWTGILGDSPNTSGHSQTWVVSRLLKLCLSPDDFEACCTVWGKILDVRMKLWEFYYWRCIPDLLIAQQWVSRSLALSGFDTNVCRIITKSHTVGDDVTFSTTNKILSPDGSLRLSCD